MEYIVATWLKEGKLKVSRLAKFQLIIIKVLGRT